MDQDTFRKILRKYLQGDALPDEKKLIDDWYVSMEEDVHHEKKADETDPEHFGWTAIHAHIKKSKRRGRDKKLLPWYAAGIAASILIVIAWGGRFLDDSVNDVQVTKSSKVFAASQDFVNKTKLTQVILLPDSSKVELEPEGKLKVSDSFNKADRAVYLEGEAFFDVSHNTRLPFTVQANEVTTKVLGTSFIIKALKHDDKITVVVRTGKVSVFTQQEDEEKVININEIILTPNQQVVYNKNEKEISRTLVKAPQAILPEEEIKRMRFHEAPVSDVFHALEKTFGVEIEFDEELFSACRITTVISKDDLYGRLNIICNVVGTSYTLQDDRIVISDAGCAKIN